MSSVTTYAQLVEARLPKTAWDEAYFSMLSLKAALQSIPGWQRFQVLAAEHDIDSVQVWVISSWDDPEYLEQWMKQSMTTENLLRQLNPLPLSVHVSVYEEVI